MSLGGTGACSQSYRDAMTRHLGGQRGGRLPRPATPPAMRSARRPIARESSPSAACATSATRWASPTSARRSRSARRPAIASYRRGRACLYPIMTTSNSGTQDPVAGAAGATYTDSFDSASLGTSFSAPLVAGTAALMLSVKPSLTPAQVRSLLQATRARLPDHRRQRRHAAMHGAERRRPGRVLLHHHDLRRRHARRACRAGRRGYRRAGERSR